MGKFSLFVICVVTLLSYDGVEGIRLNDTPALLTLGYCMPWEQGWPVGPTVGSAIVVGLEEVKRRGLLPGHEVEWVMRDTWCEPRRGMQMAVDMWQQTQQGLDAIIGPGCSSSSQPVGLLAAAWGIPIVSYGATSSKLSDKDTFPTFTRTQGTRSSRSPAFNALADLFQWRTVAVITTPEDVYKDSSLAILQDMQKAGKSVILQVVDTTIKGNEVIKEKLNDLNTVMRGLRDQARVFILASYPLALRNMLITAHDLGMLNGEYVFITHEYMLDGMNDPHDYRPDMDQVIFDGILAIGVLYPSGPVWDEFRQKVIDALQDPRFSHLPHLPADAHIEEVEVYAGNIHDALLQWAYGVNITLEQGYKANDGFRVAGNIFNLIYTGVTGLIAVNQYGDRLRDLRLIMVQNKKKIVLAEYYAAEDRMKKIYKADNSSDWSGLVWYGNQTTIPRDSPECGWQGEDCVSGEGGKKGILLSLGVIVPLICVVIVMCAMVAIKSYRRKTQLRNIRESIIKWCDVKRDEAREAGSFASLGNISRRTGGPQERHADLEVAHYQKLKVVVKRLGQNAVDLTDPKVFNDLSNMRDISHENLNLYIGLCPEAHNACYIMLYANKGTLQDILADDDTELSSDFQMSFIVDIACGMWHLHQSQIRYHGSFSSSKIVIDKRWTCKITDYGLQNICKSKPKNTGDKMKQNASKLLWSAPELLLHPKNSAVPVLKKGDVFSFAIIASEIITKDVPYGKNDVVPEPEVIVQRLKNQETPPFRPFIPSGLCKESLVDLIKSCWDENPDKRPHFNEVLVSINKIHNFNKLNLVDNMIKRLETHTNKLEEKVGIRSKELQTEKDRAENLLRELLPESIARSLASGHNIMPDTFNSVSVFFSDMVGFTAISSSSTPMEIVMMLNNVYTLFDNIAQRFDVYKVATIGDAYLVSSGVPVRNGTRHAVEICRMALELLEASFKCEIRLRIGINSGAVAAGVIGLKVPRYLLFGDTVELAAMMESSGESMKIQISQFTQELVKSDLLLRCEKRGEVNTKTHGFVTTYWLLKRGTP